MDNIKIQNDKNKITIKKGIIKKKYLVLFLILHFPILSILFVILNNFGAFENHELLENIFMYEIFCVWIIFGGVCFTGTLYYNLHYSNYHNNLCANNFEKAKSGSPISFIEKYIFSLLSLRYLSAKFCASFLFAFYILLNVLEHSWL